MSSSDIVHGSLLALREIFNHTFNFFEARYTEVADIVLKFICFNLGLF